MVKMGHAENNLRVRFEEESAGVTSEEQPPSYGAATSDSTPLEKPPPSYDSLYGKITTAKKASTSSTDFLKTFFGILINTVATTVCLAILLAVPIAMIAIGTIHLDDCPVQGMLPIYLIVGGILGALKILSNITQRIINEKADKPEQNVAVNPCDGLLFAAIIIWFIAGNIWIYGIYGNIDSEPGTAGYCDPVLYWFAYWLTTTVYIFCLATCCCFCCCGWLVITCI